MIASRHEIQRAFRTILGWEPDETTLDRCLIEVIKQDLSLAQLHVLCFSCKELQQERQSAEPAPLDILRWDAFVEAIIKAKEEQVSRLNTPADALAELGDEAWFHSFELSDGTLVRGSKTLDALRSEFDAVFAPLSLSGQSVLD